MVKPSYNRTIAPVVEHTNFTSFDVFVPDASNWSEVGEFGTAEYETSSSYSSSSYSSEMTLRQIDEIGRWLEDMLGLVPFIPALFAPFGPLYVAAGLADDGMKRLGAGRTGVRYVRRETPQPRYYRFQDMLADIGIVRTVSEENVLSSVEVAIEAANRIADKLTTIADGTAPDSMFILKNLNDMFGFRRISLLVSVLKEVKRLTGKQFDLVTSESSGDIVRIVFLPPNGEEMTTVLTDDMPENVTVYPEYADAKKRFFTAVPSDWRRSELLAMVMNEVLKYSSGTKKVVLQRRRAITRLDHYSAMMPLLHEALKVLFGSGDTFNEALSVIAEYQKTIEGRRSTFDEVERDIWKLLVVRYKDRLRYLGARAALKGYYQMSEETLEDIFKDIPDAFRSRFIVYSAVHIPERFWLAHLKKKVEPAGRAMAHGLSELKAAADSFGLELTRDLLTKFVERGMEGIDMAGDRFDKPSRMGLIAWRVALYEVGVKNISVEQLITFLERGKIAMASELPEITDALRDKIVSWLEREMSKPEGFFKGVMKKRLLKMLGVIKK